MGYVMQYETRAYSFNISESDFEKVVASIRQINCTDVFNRIIAGDGGTDGTSCAISFGNYQSTMSYKIWSPTYNAKERNLTDYVAACKVILTTAKLNPKEILGD